ncbi:MAG TPA: hypothetical protein VJ843_02420 [Candidatus Saccharimonadales bacterium]|nr:hypothetical protein [Candidatus Saccharimonadales bacterium]
MGQEKMHTSSGEFGIYATDLQELQARYRISEGVTLLDPEEAEAAGYAPRPVSRAVTIPRIAPGQSDAPLREPTDSELNEIIATPDTKRVMHILKLGQAAIEQLSEQCRAAQRNRESEQLPIKELLPGIWGVARSVRLDAPGELNVSISSKYPGKKVGDHIDEWSDPRTAFLIANLGPGARWHRVAPMVNRDVVGGAVASARAAYIASHPHPDTIPFYWFKLEPPQDGYVEAVVGSPVAWALHDGATIGSDAPSEALMCVLDPDKLAIEAYSSVV